MSDYSKLKEASRDYVGRKALPHPYLPQEVKQALLAFPANVGHLMPDARDIPDEFWDHNGRNDWVDMIDAWFARGLPGETQFYLRDGVDGDVAIRHLRTILGSFEPKHEHKVAATAYLCSLWFNAVNTGAKVYGTIPEEEN